MYGERCKGDASITEFQVRNFYKQPFSGILPEVFIGFCLDFHNPAGMPGKRVADFFKIVSFMDQLECASKLIL